MADFQSIAQQFTQYYYSTFDENRSSLAALYVRQFPIPPQPPEPRREMTISNSIKLPDKAEEADENMAYKQRDQSMLTFESASVQGTSGIVQKLVDLPFQKVQHQISTLDAQPSSAEGGIIVMVTGALKVDEEERPMNYTQVFQLLPDGAGSYFVFNDIFKLIYG
ncbi:MAG: hypothetical protein Q9223_003844 [Gallowayella weberi]